MLIFYSYFHRVLDALSSSPFYSKYVSLPDENEGVPTEICHNPKFYPFFAGALGAIDGTHIPCSPSANERHLSRNRKGGVSQNCLACCSFDLRFLYFLSGWDGSAADASIFNDARQNDLHVPQGKYYLADAGFGACDALLVPYRGVRYHLAKWGRANIRPATKEELYNLRHASARNVIERIFGILKGRFAILNNTPQFKPALAAIHNFIQYHDPAEIDEIENRFGDVLLGRTGGLAAGLVSRSETSRAQQRRDVIARAMWDSYQHVLRERQNM
jgi:hypothetical protein